LGISEPSLSRKLDRHQLRDLETIFLAIEAASADHPVFDPPKKRVEDGPRLLCRPAARMRPLRFLPSQPFALTEP